MLSLWSKSSAPCACHSVFEYNWAMEVWSNNWALWHHPWLISSRFLVCYSIIIVSIYDSYDSLGFFQICMGLVLLNQCDFIPWNRSARIWRQNRNLKRTITWPWPSLEKNMKAGPMAKGQLTEARMTVKQEELPRLVHSLQVFFFFLRWFFDGFFELLVGKVDSSVNGSISQLSDFQDYSSWVQQKASAFFPLFCDSLWSLSDTLVLGRSTWSQVAVWIKLDLAVLTIEISKGVFFPARHVGPKTSSDGFNWWDEGHCTFSMLLLL